jgi:hypothetical protein
VTAGDGSEELIHENAYSQDHMKRIVLVLTALALVACSHGPSPNEQRCRNLDLEVHPGWAGQITWTDKFGGSNSFDVHVWLGGDGIPPSSGKLLINASNQASLTWHREDGCPMLDSFQPLVGGSSGDGAALQSMPDLKGLRLTGGPSALAGASPTGVRLTLAPSP